MMTPKQRAQGAIEQLPADCTFEDVIRAVALVDKLQSRIDLADAKTDFISQEEVDYRLEAGNDPG